MECPGWTFWGRLTLDVVDLQCPKYLLSFRSWKQGSVDRVKKGKQKFPPLFLRTKVFLQFLQHFLSPNALGVQYLPLSFAGLLPWPGLPPSLPHLLGFLIFPDHPPLYSHPSCVLSIADMVWCREESSLVKVLPKRKEDLCSSPPHLKPFPVPASCSAHATQQLQLSRECLGTRWLIHRAWLCFQVQWKRHSSSW